MLFSSLIFFSCQGIDDLENSELTKTEEKATVLFQNKPLRRTDFSPNIRVEKKIEKFKSVLENTGGGRTNTTYTPAEFAETMTEYLNYEYADFSSEYELMSSRKDTIDVILDNNNKISGNEVNYLTEMCTYLVSDHFYSINESDKELLTATIQRVFINGLPFLVVNSTMGKVPTVFPQFNANDWWKLSGPLLSFLFNQGTNFKCNSTGSSSTWIGEVFEAQLSEFVGPPSSLHYVSNIEVFEDILSTATYGATLQPDPNPNIEFVTDYPLPTNFIRPRSSSNQHTDQYCESLVDSRMWCASPSDLNYYFNNYVSLINQLKPQGKDFIEIDIWDDGLSTQWVDLPNSNGNCIYWDANFWLCDISYGVINSGGQGNVLPFFTTVPDR